MVERRKGLSPLKVGWGPGASEACWFWPSSEASRGPRGLCDPAVTVFIDPS